MKVGKVGPSLNTCGSGRRRGRAKEEEEEGKMNEEEWVDRWQRLCLAEGGKMGGG